jgi:hypothetical protein
MSVAADAGQVAATLLRRLGEEGIAIVRARAEGCVDHGDSEAALFWSAVAQEMARARPVPTAPAGSNAAIPRRGTALWRFMQLIEHCRHLADKAEHKALAASTAMRGEAAQAAACWRDVAIRAEHLAETWAQRRA